MRMKFDGGMDDLAPLCRTVHHDGAGMGKRDLEVRRKDLAAREQEKRIWRSSTDARQQCHRWSIVLSDNIVTLNPESGVGEDLDLEIAWSDRRFSPSLEMSKWHMSGEHIQMINIGSRCEKSSQRYSTGLEWMPSFSLGSKFAKDDQHCDEAENIYGPLLEEVLGKLNGIMCLGYRARIFRIVIKGKR